MILMEFTPEGYGLQRISTEDIALEYQWFSYINSIASIRISLSQEYGGFAKPKFSDISLSPEMFKDIHPLPKNAIVKIIQTETDENGGVVLFDGTAHLSDYDRSFIGYNLRQPEFDSTIPEATAYDDTLVNIATALCGVSFLGLTIDTTNARTISPDVLYNTDKDVQTIDLLDDMCSFFSHGFYISEGTLYLFDMLATTTPIELTEFDVLPCSYTENEPVALIKSGDFSIDGGNKNGNTYTVSPTFHTTQANVETALADIKTIVEKDLIETNAKIDDDKPQILNTFSLTDNSLINPLTTTAIATSVVYNYDSLDMRIEGFGVIG